MPEGLIALLPALIPAATAGTEVGLQLSGALTPSTSSGPTQQQLQQQQQQQQQALTTQEQAAFKHAAPDAQSQTGGALSDPSFAAMVAELSGSPADVGLAQQTLFGSTPGLSSSNAGGS